MSESKSRYALSPGLCSVLQRAGEQSKELCTNSGKRQQLMCLFDSEFARATTHERYRNLFRKLILWLDDIPSLGLSHRVADLRMAEMATAGILVIIKLHCIETQPGFEAFLDRIEDTFSASLAAPMKDTAARRSGGGVLPEILQTEHSRTLATLLKLADKTTNAITAQIEESLIDALQRDARSLMDLTTTTTATATNVLQPEQVTLNERDAESNTNVMIDPNDPEYLNDINEPLLDDGFGGPIAIPKMRLTSPSGKSFSIEVPPGLDAPDVEETDPNVTGVEPMETEDVATELAPLQVPAADSFVLEPIHRPPSPPHRRRRRRIVSDESTKLNNLALRRQIEDRSDIVRSLEDDRASVCRKILGWETAIELLLHGPNVPRLGRDLQNTLMQTMNLPRRIRQPEPMDQVTLDDNEGQPFDAEDDGGHPHLDVHADPSYLSPIHHHAEPDITAAYAPTETFEATEDDGLTLRSATRADTASFEPSVTTIKDSVQGPAPSILEATQQLPDPSYRGSIRPSVSMRGPDTNISGERSNSDASASEVSSEEEKSIEEATRIAKNRELIARAIRLHGENYRNPRTGKLLPYIAFKDMPQTGLCDEDYLPTVMSDLMILVKSGVFICIQQCIAGQSNLYIFIRRIQ